MKIAIHITFFFVEARLIYLKKMIDNLSQIKYQKTIFIYSNRDIKAYIGDLENVEVIICQYPQNKTLNRILYKMGKMGTVNPFFMILEQQLQKILKKIKLTVHPFYLTWENRKYVEQHIDDYDIQMYLEDDIGFNADTLEYWLQYKDICLQNNYNLGFLRTEVNALGELYMTDIVSPMSKVLEIEGQHFLLNDNNPYCGFWIYDKKELKAFTKSKEWKFNFIEYDIRAKSAIGWHGKAMKRYKGTIIPLQRNSSGLCETHAQSSVHHMPNNYIDHTVFCNIKFPVILNS